MRSIGRGNIALVQSETHLAIKETGNTNVRDLVVSRLPDSLIDSWEGATAEIDRIISNTINERG
jgi:hypothetical protein